MIHVLTLKSSIVQPWPEGSHGVYMPFTQTSLASMFFVYRTHCVIMSWFHLYWVFSTCTSTVCQYGKKLAKAEHNFWHDSSWLTRVHHTTKLEFGLTKTWVMHLRNWVKKCLKLSRFCVKSNIYMQTRSQRQCEHTDIVHFGFYW